jgi:hypothetical protein
MREFKQSTADNHMVFMTDSADHITGRTGLTLTITSSKNGAAFGAIAPTVTERGNGWYALALTAVMLDTVGDLAFHVTGTGADPCDFKVLVVSRIAGDLPTATEAADALLKRDWTQVTGEAARSALNALRFLRNKWSLAGTTLTVTKEDDSAPAWTGTVATQAGADPIVGSDPA